MEKKELEQDTLADVNLIMGVIGRTTKEGEQYPTSLNFRFSVRMKNIEEFIAVVTTAPGVIGLEFPAGWKSESEEEE